MAQRFGPGQTAQIPRIRRGAAGRHSLPERYESLSLRRPIRLWTWCGGLAGLAGGALLDLRLDGAAATLAATLLVTVATAALVAVVVCRRYEIVVGTKRIDAGCGPFSHVVPSGAVIAATPRSARGWRRAYASDEVVIDYTLGAGQVVLPAGDPTALVAAIEAVAGDDVQ